MEWPDDGEHIFGEPDHGGEQPSHTGEPLADGVEPVAADAGPGDPSHAPAGEDPDAELWAGGDSDETFERWLAETPAGDATGDPAGDDSLAEALGAVPPLPDDCLSTGELIDRVVAQRLDDELGL